MLKTLISAALALAIATPAAASWTKTVTKDRPNYSSTSTVTKYPKRHKTVRDTTVTRKSDGATASRHAVRKKTRNGTVVRGSRTNFKGQTVRFRRVNPRGHR